MSERWGARDTSANWSSYGFPSLLEFREATLWDIQARARDIYDITGANQCGRVLDEYSLMWLTPDQEKQFKDRFEEVYHYARQIDRVMRRPPTADDTVWWNIWKEHKVDFARLPKFRVRPDIEGESDKVPPRTGVYIPQGDPWGTPQFAWTGGDASEDGSRYYGGKLGKVVTLNALGLEAMETVGRSDIWPWDDGAGAVDFLRRKGIKNRHGEEVFDLHSAIGILAGAVYASGVSDPFIVSAGRNLPCKWHYVELLEGEFEDANEPVAQFVPKRGPGMYANSGEACPYPGVWECVERPVGTQTVAFGVPMPQLDGLDVTWRLLKGI
jgi:hypothetical protein